MERTAPNAAVIAFWSRQIIFAIAVSDAIVFLSVDCETQRRYSWSAFAMPSGVFIIPRHEILAMRLV
jgi:hypothetical protein